MIYPSATSFQPQSISAETLEINAALARKMAAATPPADLADARKRFARGERTTPVGPRSAAARTVEIEGSAGLAVRILGASRPTGVYLHLHGGGWMLGTADMWDDHFEQIIADTGLTCVSVEYRLAPEHPFPAALDDCVAAANWLIEQAPSRFGTGNLTIGGESAGAHLAVLTLLRLRAASRQHHFRAANLAFGVYDLSRTPSAWRAQKDTVVNRQDMLDATTAFIGNRDPRGADVSPLYAELGGLPPALFSVGSLDPLLDDSLLMHARWLCAGNDAELAVYPGGLHGFTALGGELARQANQRANAFLRQALDTDRAK